MRRFLLPSLAALGLLACQGDGLTDLEIDGPLTQIFDGTSTDVGANADVFFLPPLVANPSGHANWDDGEFNPNLRVRFEICQLTGDPSPIGGVRPVVACIAGPLIKEFPEDDVEVSVAGEKYKVEWHTYESNLSPSEFYRLNVLVGPVLLAFIDLDAVLNGGQANRVDYTEFAAVRIGRTIPIEVRIENGALCDPNAVVCTEETVNLDDGGTVTVQIPDGQGNNVNLGVELPGQEGTGQPPEVTVVVQACLDGAGNPENLPIDIPLFGDCIQITTVPELTNPLQNLATVVVCVESSALVGLKPNQADHILVHRQDDDVVVALPNAPDFCATLEARNIHGNNENPGFLARSWHHLRETVLSVVQPLPLEARRRRLDRGRGGVTPDFSRFQLGLPSKMEPLPGTLGQSAPAGTQVANPPAVLVTDFANVAVEGATVSFAVTGGGGSIVTMTDVTGPDGVASADGWTLGAAPGPNAVDGSGRGISNAALANTFTPAFTGDPATEIPVLLEVGVVTFDASGTTELLSCGPPGFPVYLTGPFYIPDYPGSTVHSLEVPFTGAAAHTAEVLLTVRAASYDGALLGTATAFVTVSGVLGEFTTGEFAFDPAISVTPGSTVTFQLEKVSPEDLFYQGTAEEGCGTILTPDATPPLSAPTGSGVVTRVIGLP